MSETRLIFPVEFVFLLAYIVFLHKHFPSVITQASSTNKEEKPFEFNSLKSKLSVGNTIFMSS